MGAARGVQRQQKMVHPLTWFVIPPRDGGAHGVQRTRPETRRGATPPHTHTHVQTQETAASIGFGSTNSSAVPMCVSRVSAATRNGGDTHLPGNQETDTSNAEQRCIDTHPVGEQREHKILPRRHARAQRPPEVPQRKTGRKPEKKKESERKARALRATPRLRPVACLTPFHAPPASSRANRTGQPYRAPPPPLEDGTGNGRRGKAPLKPETYTPPKKRRQHLPPCTHALKLTKHTHPPPTPLWEAATTSAIIPPGILGWVFGFRLEKPDQTRQPASTRAYSSTLVARV